MITSLKAKIKHNDDSYTVNIDEVWIAKFNDLVDVANKLSEKTLLIHERRKLLLEHVVEERFERASDMEIMLDRSLKSTHKSCCAYAAADSNSFRDPDRTPFVIHQSCAASTSIHGDMLHVHVLCSSGIRRLHGGGGRGGLHRPPYGGRVQQDARAVEKFRPADSLVSLR